MARPNLDRHPKFALLKRQLNEPRPHVRGYLECLWEAAYENGDPVIGAADMVEAVCEYPGERGKLFRALLECGGPGRAGFIEPVPGRDDVFQIHDLDDHAPEYVRKRRAREAARKATGRTLSGVRAEAASQRWHPSSDGQADANGRQLQTGGDGQLQTDADGSDGPASGTPPAPAPAPAPAPGEGLTPPTPSGSVAVPPKRRGRESVPTEPAGFEEFWAAYPRKVAKAAARTAWAKLAPDDALRAAIREAIRRSAAGDQWNRDGGRYIPHPATWLHGRRWEDEVARSPGDAHLPPDGAPAVPVSDDRADEILRAFDPELSRDEQC
jgi:hypothetical protein